MVNARMQRLFKGVVTLTAALTVYAIVPHAQADAAQQPGSTDLLSKANLQIKGAAYKDEAGYSVAGAGDVNNDGRDDVIVGARWADNNGRTDSGSAYVIFGGSSLASIDLASLGSSGFRIDGAAAGDTLGWSVAGAGDVNDDGNADVIVGAPAYRTRLTESGDAYVVFGKSSTGAVDLASLGGDGFRIDGVGANDYAGWAVSEAGDTNGDGKSDVLVGAPHAGNAGSFPGSAYLVYGKTSAATVALASLGADGVRVDGVAGGDWAGGSVAAAGDVKGDGRAAFIVGAGAADNAGTNSGSTYVVFATASGVVNLGSLGSDGFRIDGQSAGDAAGTWVGGTGDMNSDGHADLIVGATQSANNGALSGSAYVVFGGSSTGTVQLASLGSRGFRIDGAAAGDRAGTAVDGIGDVDGDGRPDVIVGANGANNNGGYSGSTYVIFGKTSNSTIDLTALGTQGYRLDGENGNDQSGFAAAGAGDVNGDGGPDLIIGAMGHGSNQTAVSGSAYVFYGAPSAPPVTQQPGGPSDSSRVTTTSSCKRLSAAPKLSSVSNWTPLGRGSQARVRGPVGGLVLRGNGTAKIRLQTKQVRGPRARVKQVVFKLDGKKLSTVTRAPFNATVKTDTISRGTHRITATVKQRAKQRVLTYKVLAAECRPARFSAAMGSKKRGVRPSLKLTAQTYGPELDAVRFLLPRQLGVTIKSKVRGKKIGTLRLKLAGGARRSISLKAPRKNSKQLSLVSSGSTRVKLDMRSKRQILVSGVPAGVTEMAVVLPGKKAKLLRNTKRCSKLSYKATLTDRTKTSLSLVSGARVCY